MEIQVHKVGEITIIGVSGQANISAQPERIQQLVRERLSAGEQRFLIDLAECSWMDSTALGSLITSLVTTIRHGGKLKLVRVPHSVRGILTVSNLTQVFEIFDDEPTAIKSFDV